MEPSAVATLTVSAQAPRVAKPDPAKPPLAVPARHGIGFHELLSSCNPLQYIPVVGSLYRNLTGDTIPETNRMAGSLVFSGLTGGPVGMLTNVAATAFEKITGIDPDQIGRSVLTSLGLMSKPATPAPTATAAFTPTPSPEPPKALSASQLAAYGVKRDAAGTLQRGAVSGADVLNDIELARLGHPAATLAAYDAGRDRPPGLSRLG